jgi:hypothetical protein
MFEEQSKEQIEKFGSEIKKDEVNIVNKFIANYKS